MRRGQWAGRVDGAGSRPPVRLPQPPCNRRCRRRQQPPVLTCLPACLPAHPQPAPRPTSYGLDLLLLSIDEGISGYRDDSLETVKRNEAQYQVGRVLTAWRTGRGASCSPGRAAKRSGAQAQVGGQASSRGGRASGGGRRKQGCGGPGSVQARGAGQRRVTRWLRVPQRHCAATRLHPSPHPSPTRSLLTTPPHQPAPHPWRTDPAARLLLQGPHTCFPCSPPQRAPTLRTDPAARLLLQGPVRLDHGRGGGGGGQEVQLHLLRRLPPPGGCWGQQS